MLAKLRLFQSKYVFYGLVFSPTSLSRTYSVTLSVSISFLLGTRSLFGNRDRPSTATVHRVTANCSCIFSYRRSPICGFSVFTDGDEKKRERERNREREAENQRLVPLVLTITSLFTARYNVIRHSSAFTFSANMCYISETCIPFETRLASSKIVIFIKLIV